MNKDDSIYIEHILKCLQDAVIRQLEIIGEATKKISDNLKEKHPDIPWKDIAGMRDKLIHDYIDIDLSVVWKTASEDVPFLKNLLNDV
ncbi:MAG: DUF86 domain-containing protein [Bacteroidia bacterium]|nr:DUF86 domain-containing protein [Bacteroidia bacterium]